MLLHGMHSWAYDGDEPMKPAPEWAKNAINAGSQGNTFDCTINASSWLISSPASFFWMAYEHPSISGWNYC